MSRTNLTPVRLADDQLLGKPPSMKDSECGTLYVRVEPYAHNPQMANLISRWILTDEQRQQIADGTHEILLGSVGGQMPVMLYVSDEFNTIDPTNGQPMEWTRWNPPHGWIYSGPDGEIHWSERYDTHESATDHRPATYIEKWFFIHAGPPSEFGGATFKMGLHDQPPASENQIESSFGNEGWPNGLAGIADLCEHEFIEKTHLGDSNHSKLCVKCGLSVSEDCAKGGCVICGGLNTSCPDGCNREPEEAKAAYQTHETRYSDSSLYDEKCVRCGATDARGDKGLDYPCPNPEGPEKY